MMPLNSLKIRISSMNLLPNDAIIAATCKAGGITRIATFDADLEGIGFLNSVDL